MKEVTSRIAGALLSLILAFLAVNASAQTAFGVDGAGNLVKFDVATPGTIVSATTITGLTSGDTLVGLDFRPATGDLLALGSGSRLYRINPATAVATQIGSDGAFTLFGTSFGFDVNPVPDRVRVTSESDQNLRLNPNDGTLAATDGTLAYAVGDPNVGTNPNVVGSAYTNSFAGSTSTTLYAIDSNLDTLVIQNPPNSGTLNTVGALGVNVSAVLGFDIVSAAGGSNVAYASMVVGGVNGLYTINLATGSATLVGAIGAATPLQGLAIAPAGQLRLSATAYNVTEGSPVTVTVNRVSGSFGAVTALLSTADGTATSPADYGSLSTTVSFADGDSTPQTFLIPTVNDAAPENVQTFSVALSGATGGATLGAAATVFIIDDEIAPDVAYGIDASNNNLVKFYVQAPGLILASTPISGLAGGDTVLGIDFRPATGDLLALGSGSRLYRIDPATAAATQVGSDGAFTLSGTSFGFDVNPVPDRVRITSDGDQNIRVNPNDGTLAATDGTLAYAAGDPNAGANPNIVGSAYSNSFAGASSTTLYAIDSALDILVIQNPPNSGTLNTVGPLGVDASGVLGFDIVSPSGGNFAYASMVVAGVPGIYSIDLTTGSATLVGTLGGATTLRGCAIAAAAPGVAPVFTSANTTNFVIGTLNSFTVTATGTPAPTFTIATPLPSGINFDSVTGVLSGIPGPGTAGPAMFNITAQNGVPPNAQQAFALVILPAPAAPVITSAASASFSIGSPVSFTVTGTGSPAPTFAVTGTFPTGVSFNAGTHAFTGTPGSGTAGTYNLTVTASNGVLPNATQPFTLTVLNAPGIAPVITSTNATTFVIGTAGSFTVTATGTPAPTFTIATPLPAGINFDSVTGVLSGIPGAGTAGPHMFNVTAQNGALPNAGQTFALVILSPAAPVVTSPGAASFAVGSFTSFAITATGSPTPTIALSGGLPPGLSFDSSTGMVSGIPGAGSSGTYNLTITASNGVLPNASQPLTLTVAAAPANATPVPSLSPSSLLLLTLLLAAGGMVGTQGRRKR